MDAAARRSFHVGKYHCVESLTQGPLGETFRAKVYGVAGLEKQYALKQIDAALRVDPDLRGKLLDAARWYARLEHERIARLVEINDEAESLYFVVELSRGIDLQRLATHLRGRGESLPVDQAILIALDIAEALEVAHAAGVVHAGLCPSVVAVLGEGEVRVSDFAISSVLSRPGWADDDALVSLIAYSAPERLQGEAANPFSDLWAVGALLYELSSGQPLQTGTTAAALATARALPIAWERVPTRPGLHELLRKLLASDPLARPHSATELKEALAALLSLDLSRARAGLQGLAKRALGRAMTRTGSFAAVAIPSASFPALAAEPPAVVPQANAGARTLVGLSTATPSAPQPSLPAPAKGRAWAPPRATGTIPVVSDSGPITLRGMGSTKPQGEGEPPQMELAVLPPPEAANEASTIPGDHSGAENTMPVPFEDALTSPHDRIQLSEATLTDEPVLMLEAAPSDSVANLIADGNNLEQSELLSVDEGPTNQVVRMVPPPPPPPPPVAVVPPPVAAVPPPVAVVPPPPPPTVTRETLSTLVPSAEPPLPPPSAPLAVDTIRDAAPPIGAKRGGGGGIAIALLGVVLIVGGVGFLWWKRHVAAAAQGAIVVADATPQAGTDPVPPEPTPALKPAPLAAPSPDLAAPVDMATPWPEPKPVVVKPAPVEPKPAPVEPKPAPVEPKPAPVEPKPAPVVVKPAPVEPKPAPVAVKPAVAADAGSLSVQSTPSGADVWLDGERRGTTPLSTPASAGSHKLVLVLAGKKVLQKQITVEQKGTTIEQALEQVKLPDGFAGNGGLKVRCKTTGELRILVDGNDTGVSCPNDERISVQPGTHTIGLYSPRTGDTKTVEGEIDDDPDRSTRIYTKY